MTQAQTPRGERNPDHHVRVEQSPKWVRVVAGGHVVADSKRVQLLRETGHTPVYYFPREDVRMEYLEPTDRDSHCPYKGNSNYWTLKAGDKVEENAVWSYEDPYDYEGSPDIKDHIAFYWGKVDAWFEENEQVYVHARDPYKRIDVIPSTRHVEIKIDGETIADTHSPAMLFETGLPVRYYIPLLDVRMDKLTPTDRVTRCPYKGQAAYYSVTTSEREHQDVAWYYTYPTPESTGIKGSVSFFNERVDVVVDGEEQVRPKTKWSTPA